MWCPTTSAERSVSSSPSSGWRSGSSSFSTQRSGVGTLIAVQLFAGLATNAIFPVLYAFGSDSAEPGAMGTANSILLFFLYIGGVSPLVIGFLIGLGGGFENATGYFYALYFLVAVAIISAVIMALFTRETVGRFKDRDRRWYPASGPTSAPGCRRS